MTAHTAIIIIFTLLDLLCIIAVIFVERKNPASTIAWALVLIFVPFLGFAAYLMFGSGFHVNKKKKYALKRISDALYRRVISKYIGNTLEESNAGDIPSSRLVRYLQYEGGHYLTHDNGARIFTSGQEMFAFMKEDIRRAKKHVHLLYYIIRNDALGRDIVSLLTKKAESGVTVRVMYDSLGSLLSGGRIFKPLLAAGGEVVAFSPILFTISSHLRLNYRNHRKITVVDGEVGYVGGMNIGEEYCGRHKRLRPWRDTHLRLTGSSVSFLQERFLIDWMSVAEHEPKEEEFELFFAPPLKRGNLAVQIASSGPDTHTSSIKYGLLEMLYTAKKNVYIQTPYFTPDDSLIDALRIAASAGVDVRLMIPGVADHLVVGAATSSYAWQLLEAGVKVYRYKGFLHAKTMVIDGTTATIGTTNIGARSFSLNFEVNAFIYDLNFAQECERIFLQDQQHCEQLEPSWFKSRNPAVRAAYGVCRLFAPLI